MGLLGSPFPRPSLSYCERDRSDEPVRILYSAEPSVGSKRAIGCSNILSFGKPLEGLKAGNRRSNNRTIYVRMRLTIYLFYLFIYLTVRYLLLLRVRAIHHCLYLDLFITTLFSLAFSKGGMPVKPSMFVRQSLSCYKS